MAAKCPLECGPQRPLSWLLFLLVGQRVVGSVLHPVSCPVETAALGWACPSENQSQELLADPTLADLGTGSPWGLHVWEPNGARLHNVTGVGAVLDVNGDPTFAHDISLFQQLTINATHSYELCLQVGASEAGSHVRFAVDGGQALEYAVAGGGQRVELEADAQSLSTECFRFSFVTQEVGSSTYPARVVLDLGGVNESLSVCQISLRQCMVPFPSNSPCPTLPLPLDVWRCDAGDLGEELLPDPSFSGTPGIWNTYLWKAGEASFDWSSPGVLVNVNQHEDAKLLDVLLYQSGVTLGGNSSSASYELCVQANATVTGDHIQFAVDGDAALNFATAGGGIRRTYMSLEAGKLVSSCFRFTLGASLEPYEGRVALELGNIAGQVSVCQASLRRCTSPVAATVEPARRCYLAPLEQGLGCEKLQALHGAEFELNQYGHETTGLRKCLDKLRNAKGDTFTFAPGHCDLWRCSSRQNLLAAAAGNSSDRMIYSEFCQYQEPTGGRHGEEVRRSPVFLQLWDWSFLDVARECEEYLGPNGFDGVQISPVTEHLLGGSWWTKYQPVSFRLESRSGSRQQLQEMVRRCRSAGVQVVADVILNHVGRPCFAVAKVGYGAGMPCHGWAGSPFGNRRVGGLEGWPLMSPDHFHHLVGDKLTNCPVDQERYQCPDSTPPNDCSMCDLYGLPDWKTELPSVQEMLWKHLEELHDLGVTMLRIDAASYMHVEDLAAFMNRAPWDFVVQEWWDGVPEVHRSRFVGHYRDFRYGAKIKEALEGDSAAVGQLLDIDKGNDGIVPEEAVATLTDHDRKDEVSYKAGLAFHQWQKWLLAWPRGFSVRLFSGFGWATTEDGPPGCEKEDAQCQPRSVFDGDENECMRDPVRSPLDLGLSTRRVWVCEHRWSGVAGLVNFRKACRGLPVERTWLVSERGRVAFRAGHTCFAALQKGYNAGAGAPAQTGEWSLAGMESGLPPGRYCDLASLPTLAGWERRSCPREVTVDAGGFVVEGVVPSGDVLAIHTGAQLSGSSSDSDTPSQACPLLPGSSLLLAMLLCMGFMGHGPMA